MKQCERGALSPLLAGLMSDVEEAVQRAYSGLMREPEGGDAALFLTGDSRVQPLILLLASECAGGASARSVSLATVVELVHAALLVHDGVRDDGTELGVRLDDRGKWQKQTSVLRGDYLLATAVGALAADGNMSFLPDLMRVFAEMCEGQARFLQARGSFLGIPAYLDALRMRAGALTAFSARAGLLAADGPLEYAEAFGAFGESFGVAFHLAGEIRDLVEDRRDGLERVLAPDRWLTLPLALTAQCGDREHAVLEAILAKGDFLPDDLAEIRRLATDSGAVSRCWDLVDEWLASAVKHLIVIPETPAKRLLSQTSMDLCGGQRRREAEGLRPSLR
jgi:geranylgeranyl pyrophosphate synthase